MARCERIELETRGNPLRTEAAALTFPLKGLLCSPHTPTTFLCLLSSPQGYRTQLQSSLQMATDSVSLFKRWETRQQKS